MLSNLLIAYVDILVFCKIPSGEGFVFQDNPYFFQPPFFFPAIFFFSIAGNEGLHLTNLFPLFFGDLQVLRLRKIHEKKFFFEESVELNNGLFRLDVLVFF